jgi:hypothetical protein
MEPTSTGAGAAYAISKIFYAVGGIFGSGSIGAFWQPKALEGYGRYAKGLIIGGVGALAPVMVGSLLAEKLGLDPYSADVGMAIGTVVGLSIMGILAFAANYFKNREGMDIVEVAQEAKAIAKGVKNPTRKPASKRPAAKKVAK